MSAPEISPQEAVKVAAFGFDSPDGAEAGIVLALLDTEVKSRPNPMNGDGINYGLQVLREKVVRRFPDEDARSLDQCRHGDGDAACWHFGDRDGRDG